MVFGKKRKARQELAECWRAMEMSCENNYKDMAQDGLREYEEKLTQYHEQGLVSDSDYQENTRRLQEKKEELRGYDHKQHIGW